eukprot:15473738-Alexandrium_andersonii.AAC.1
MAVYVKDRCPHELGDLFGLAFGHLLCECCGGYVGPGTRICVRGTEAVITSARMSNFGEGYLSAFREGGIGAGQVSLGPPWPAN